MHFRVVSLCFILGLVASSQSRLRSEKRGIRRVHRQVSERIPYASLSTGAVPLRLRNRLRGNKPSTASSSKPDSSSGSSSVGGDSVPSGAGVSTGYGSNPYGGGSSGYQFGDGGYSNPSGGQSYGQPQYNQQGGVRVPTGSSTFPYGSGQITGSYQNRYSAQQTPMPSYGGRGGGRSGSPWYPNNQRQTVGYGSQIPQPYPPYGGYSGVGYGGNYRMGGNQPYGSNAYGGAGGGLPQTSYGSSYGGVPQNTGGYYGRGYGGGGYSNTPRGTAIGSPYRDPSSPYTSYIHPSHGSSGRSYGNSGSYGRGRGGSSSLQSSSSHRASNSRGLGNSRSGHSRGGSGSSYYGGASSAGRGSTYAYGQSQPSASSGRSSYGRYGGTSGQYGAGSKNPYGSYGGGSFSGSTYRDGSSYGQPNTESRYGSTSADHSRYGQTGGSSFGSTSDGSYGQTTERGQYGADSQSSYQNYDSVADSGAGAGQSETYYNHESSAEPNSAGSSSVYPQHNQGEQYRQSPRDGGRGSSSKTIGRFYNPGSKPSQPNLGTTGSQSVPSYSQQRPGGFYNPSAAEESRNPSSPRPGYYAPDGNSTGRVGVNRAQSDSPTLVGMQEPAGPEENYENQAGTFLIPRRNEGLPNVERGKKGGKRGRIRHPALKKCERQDDGLPDLYVDHRRMKNSVYMDRRNLTSLSCAKSENCLPRSAYTANAIRIRKLLRFATIAHNNGTADFLPDLHEDDWIYHSCHEHWHSMKEFAHFHLIHSNGSVVGEGHKVSFCLEDSGCKNPCKKKYVCTRRTQGISPGCYDSYLASRDCQWIDITHVASGSYILRVTVNPLVDGIRAVPELSYTNNIVECDVSITVNSAEASRCWMK